MHIEKYSVAGISYLRLVASKRVLNKRGKSVTGKRLVLSLGPLSKHDDGKPEYLERLRASFSAGNTLDHHTLRPALKNTLGDFGLERFVLVADRGMYSGTNMYAVREAGNGYIVSKSLRKTDRRERAWATDPKGYTVVSADFRHKSRIVKRTVTDERGGKHEIQEKVVYWSRSFYERERNENKSFMEFLRRLKENPGSYRITAAQSKGLRRFLKREYVNKVTGETVDSTNLMPMIDEEKLNEFNDLMGYYQIVTSELVLGDREIIEKYHGLTQIEDQFREMKGTLETRPIFVNTPEHVKAHLMVCFIALTMLRIIQRRIKMTAKSKRDSLPGWSYGLSGGRIAEALNGWKVLEQPGEQPGEYYQMLNSGGDDLYRILKAFGMDLKPKLYTRGEIRDMKAAACPF